MDPATGSVQKQIVNALHLCEQERASTLLSHNEFNKDMLNAIFKKTKRLFSYRDKRSIKDDVQSAEGAHSLPPAIPQHLGTILQTVGVKKPGKMQYLHAALTETLKLFPAKNAISSCSFDRNSQTLSCVSNDA
nr:hypothetical protein [Tanacetum cinerariifolium]